MDADEADPSRATILITILTQRENPKSLGFRRVQHQQRLGHLSPEGCFIAAKALDGAGVNMAQAKGHGGCVLHSISKECDDCFRGQPMTMAFCPDRALQSFVRGPVLFAALRRLAAICRSDAISRLLHGQITGRNLG